MDFNRITRTVAPTTLPVSVEDCRRHLALPDTDDDYIKTLIEAATAMIDGPNGIGIALCPQTYRMSLHNLRSTFTLPVYPVIDIVSVAWLDHDDANQTTSGYRVDTDCNPARVYLKDRYCGDSAQSGTAKITFRAGFETVPADLKHAILLIVGHLFENREATSTVKLETVPMAVESILARYRVV